MMIKATFSKWLTSQVGRSDPIGDLAGDWGDDTDHTRSQNPYVIIDYLERSGACSEAIDAFYMAWSEFSGIDLRVHVLLESKPSRRKGMFPYHIETLWIYRQKGPGDLSWYEIFRGTDEECTEKLEALLESERPSPAVDVTAEPERRKFERAAMTPRLRYSILARDGFRCKKCGRAAADGVKLHVDHIHPVSRGGITRPDNLETLCQQCNLGKGNLVLAQEPPWFSDDNPLPPAHIDLTVMPLKPE